MTSSHAGSGRANPDAFIVTEVVGAPPAPSTKASQGRGGVRQAKLADNPPQSPVDRLYNAFVSIFGNSNPQQVFSLIWPGTILAADSYAGTPAAGAMGSAEALVNQSLLFDQYYPLATITQPDGTRVSDRYQQAIDRYGILPNASLIELQNIIRERLARTVQMVIDGQTVTMTLLDQFDYLNNRWTALKQQWSELQATTLAKLHSSGDVDWFDQYILWYEVVAPGYIAAINAAYDRLIAEFPLNAFEDAISILDTREAAALDRAKIEIDYATLPVPPQIGIDFVATQAVPADWATVLTPTTTFMDLLSAPDAQQAFLDQAVGRLNQQILAWNAILAQIPAGSPQDIANALSAFQTAQTTYQTAQANLISQYGANTLTAVKVYLQYKQDSADNAAAATSLLGKLDAETPSGAPPDPSGTTITPDQFDKIAKEILSAQNQLIGANSSLISAGQDLASKASNYLNTVAGQGLREVIQPVLAQLTSQLATVQQQVANVNSAALRTIQLIGADGKTDASSSAGLATPADLAANQRWAEVTIEIDSSDMSTSSSTSTAFSQFDWSVDFFFGSAGGTSTSSSESFASQFMSSNSKIQIGMLATKVLIQRPWMHPELFAMSGSYFRSTQDPVTTPAPQAGSAWMRTQFVPESLGGGVGVTPAEAAAAATAVNAGPFPAYPVALLVVKDVTIKLSFDATKTDALQAYSQSNSTQEGGFLCFNVSSTQAATSSSKSASNYTMGGTYSYRIQAPQVAGAWLQITPADRSTTLTPELAAQIASTIGFATRLKSAANAPREAFSRPVKPS